MLGAFNRRQFVVQTRRPYQDNRPRFRCRSLELTLSSAAFLWLGFPSIGPLQHGFHPLTTVAKSPPEKTSYRAATLLALEFTLLFRPEDSARLRCKKAGYCVADCCRLLPRLGKQELRARETHI